MAAHWNCEEGFDDVGIVLAQLIPCLLIQFPAQHQSCCKLKAQRSALHCNRKYEHAATTLPSDASDYNATLIKVIKGHLCTYLQQVLACTLALNT